MLGTWGNVVLDFYIENNIWINALVLLYAVLVFLGRASYRRSALFLLKWFQEKYDKDARLKSQSNLIRLIEKEEIPWDLAKESFWFPLITPPNRFVLYNKNQLTLRKLFNKETLVNLLRPLGEPPYSNAAHGSSSDSK